MRKRPIIRRIAAPCIDSLSAYARFGKTSSISHFVPGAKLGTRKIGQSIQIQKVNARHSRMKDVLRPFKGAKKTYLDG